MLNATSLTRRRFLTQTAGLTCGVLTTPLLQYSKAIAAPYEIPAAQTPMLSVLRWLGKFALDIAADVLQDYLSDWIKGENDSTRKTARAAVRDIDNQGFTQYNNSRVYSAKNYYYYFYGSTNIDGFHALTPFQYNQREYTVLGGPAILGLYNLQEFLVRNNPRMSPSQLAYYVLPGGPVDIYCDLCFTFDAPWYAEYQTTQGYVWMDYTHYTYPYRNRQGQWVPGTGYLETSSRDHRGYSEYARSSNSIVYI